MVMIRNSFSLLKNNLVVLKGFSLLFSLRMLQIILGLGSTYFLVRAISQEQYGSYQFVLSTAGALCIFSLPEMNNASMQSLARGFPGTYRQAMKTVLLGCTVASFILAGMAAWYFLIDEKRDIAFAFLIAAALYPLCNGLTQWRSLRLAQEKFSDLVRLEGVNSMATSTAIILAALAFPGSYILPLSLYLLLPSLRNIITTISDLKSLPGTAAAEDGVIRYGVHTSLYSGIALFAERLDKVLLFFFLTPAAVALYAAAERMAELFRSLTQDLAASLAPRMAKKKTYTKKLDDAFKLYAAGMGAALVVFSFTLLPWAFRLVFTHSYDAAIPYAQALICSVAIGNLAAMRFRYIRSRMDSDSYRKITLVSAFVRLASLFLLVPFFGLAGAVAVSFIYRIFMSHMVHVMMKRRYFIEMSSCQQQQPGVRDE